MAEGSPADNLTEKQNLGAARRHSVHTLKSDAADLLHKTDISLIDLVSREAEHRREEKEFLEEKERGNRFLIAVIVSSIIVLSGIGGAAYYFFFGSTEREITEAPKIYSTYIEPDETAEINISAWDRSGLISDIKKSSSNKLDPNSLKYLSIKTFEDEDNYSYPSSLDIISMLEFNVSEDFTKSLQERWNMFILYKNDGEDLVLVFETVSPKRALSGMRNWEKNMRDDFNWYMGKQKIKTKKVPILPALFPQSGTSTLKSSDSSSDSLVFDIEDGTATYTIATYAVENEPEKIIKEEAKFADFIIKNTDSRILTFPDGEQGLGYAVFSGRLIIIATSPRSLEEMLSRFMAGPLRID